jgi:hypothetical protein
MLLQTAKRLKRPKVKRLKPVMLRPKTPKHYPK